MELDGTDPQGRERRGRMATSAAFFVQGLHGREHLIDTLAPRFRPANEQAGRPGRWRL